MFEVITFSVFSSYLFPSLPTHSLQLAFASWAESALWLEIQTLGPEQRCYLLPLWGTSLLSVQFLWRQKVRSVYLPKFLLILKSLIYFALTYTYLKIVAVWTYCIWLQWFRVMNQTADTCMMPLYDAPKVSFWSSNWFVIYPLHHQSPLILQLF